MVRDLNTLNFKTSALMELLRLLLLKENSGGGVVLVAGAASLQFTQFDDDSIYGHTFHCRATDR